MPPKNNFTQDWNASGIHEDLVIALVDEMKPSGQNWESILSRMHQKGYQFTRKALRYLPHTPSLSRSSPSTCTYPSLRL